jgi:hypothetical protein
MSVGHWGMGLKGFERRKTEEAFQWNDRRHGNIKYTLQVVLIE